MNKNKTLVFCLVNMSYEVQFSIQNKNSLALIGRARQQWSVIIIVCYCFGREHKNFFKFLFVLGKPAVYLKKRRNRSRKLNINTEIIGKPEKYIYDLTVYKPGLLYTEILPHIFSFLTFETHIWVLTH